jgi:hypothetical protein
MSRLFGGTLVTSRRRREHRAGVGPVEPAEDPQRGGLAAPRRPEQRDQLAFSISRSRPASAVTSPKWR